MRLANVNGRALGWLDRPARRSQVLVLWDGTLDGRPVRDGYYQVELVVAGRVAAAAGFRLDRTPARLDQLRISSNSPPFDGDGPLLATLSPNGDGFRDYARIHFDLTEPAAVTLDVQRTAMDDQRVHPHVALPRGPALDRLAACSHDPARTYLPAGADDRGLRREHAHLRLLRPVRRPEPARAGRAVQGSTRRSPAELFAPGQLGALRSPPTRTR